MPMPAGRAGEDQVAWDAFADPRSVPSSVRMLWMPCSRTMSTSCWSTRARCRYRLDLLRLS